MMVPADDYLKLLSSPFIIRNGSFEIENGILGDMSARPPKATEIAGSIAKRLSRGSLEQRRAQGRSRSSRSNGFVGLVAPAD
jgi:hypothetical protein